MFVARRIIGRTGTPTTVYKWNTTQGWRTSQGPADASQPLTFSYTAPGRLAGFSDATTGHVVSAAFNYDASGQRTRSDVTVNGTQTLTDYAYAGITLPRLSATQGESTWQLSYLYDEEGVPYAGVYRSPTSSTAPVVFAMVTTDRGDVVELLDANGAPFAAYRYDPWGVPTSTATQGTTLINSTLAAQIASRQILRYAGYVYDPDIGPATCGTYYLSARHYDPATRQFLSKDAAKADGEESAYQYCDGEPVGMVDPTGLSKLRSERKGGHFVYHERTVCRIRLSAEWHTNGSRVWGARTEIKMRMCDGYFWDDGLNYHEWTETANYESSGSRYFEFNNNPKGGWTRSYKRFMTHSRWRCAIPYDIESRKAESRQWNYLRGWVGVKVWASPPTHHGRPAKKDWYVWCTKFKHWDHNCNWRQPMELPPHAGYWG